MSLKSWGYAFRTSTAFHCITICAHVPLPSDSPNQSVTWTMGGFGDIDSEYADKKHANIPRTCRANLAKNLMFHIFTNQSQNILQTCQHLRFSSIQTLLLLLLLNQATEMWDQNPRGWEDSQPEQKKSSQNWVPFFLHKIKSIGKVPGLLCHPISRPAVKACSYLWFGHGKQRIDLEAFNRKRR